MEHERADNPDALAADLEAWASVLENAGFPPADEDNRIPPRGFTNAAFEAGQAQPVGASYADGQYWDDTSFAIPAGASYATVSVYHQTTSKEYIDFLHTEDVTDSKGDIAYDRWVAAGDHVAARDQRPVQAHGQGAAVGRRAEELDWPTPSMPIVNTTRAVRRQRERHQPRAGRVLGMGLSAAGTRTVHSRQRFSPPRSAFRQLVLGVRHAHVRAALAGQRVLAGRGPVANLRPPAFELFSAKIDRAGAVPRPVRRQRGGGADEPRAAARRNGPGRFPSPRRGPRPLPRRPGER
jgi:hypothetical protein